MSTFYLDLNEKLPLRGSDSNGCITRHVGNGNACEVKLIGQAIEINDARVVLVPCPSIVVPVAFFHLFRDEVLLNATFADHLTHGQLASQILPLSWVSTPRVRRCIHFFGTRFNSIEGEPMHFTLVNHGIGHRMLESVSDSQCFGEDEFLAVILK